MDAGSVTGNPDGRSGSLAASARVRRLRDVDSRINSFLQECAADRQVCEDGAYREEQNADGECRGRSPFGSTVVIASEHIFLSHDLSWRT